jgi:D-alanyl-lipoteichoic acid acyltransferase DltB (MBOAT superfamily)
MVFSDPVFIALFLPAALLLFHVLRWAAGGAAALAALIGLSMLFYAYWNVAFLAVLLAQIMSNYVCARLIARRGFRFVLPIAIAFNLLLLGYFKYRNFFLANAGALLGIDFRLAALVVPLAISFHTFQQIALLADVSDGEADVPPLIDYTFFVLFFPQLIAGPIVLHREMGHQVRALRQGQSPGLSLFGEGVVLLLLGLFKKICLADPIGVYADLAFAPGATLHTTEAWAGATSYALQLFFDFSGYSDMAVGLGLMFGFRLPFNFLVPFAAPSMIDYWKRWHITMTRFFTMYVYTPVALHAARVAARRGFGTGRRFLLCVGFPTLLTFLLSGLWHGAGWNFVMFGAVNGIGLCINHAWRAMTLPRLPVVAGRALTAITVLVTLVYFRSATMAQADGFLARMFVPDHLLSAPGWLLERYPLLPFPRADFDIFGDARQTVSMLLWIGMLAPLSVLLPPLAARPDALRPGWRLAAAAASMAVLVAGVIDQPRSFLYFAF